MALGHFKEALVDCDNSLTLEPEFFKAYLRRARVSKVLGDYVASVRDYRKYMWSSSAVHVEYRDAQAELDEVLALLHATEAGSGRARGQARNPDRAGRSRSGYADFSHDFEDARQSRRAGRGSSQNKPSPEPGKSSGGSPRIGLRKEPTHYEVLGVSCGAAERDIKLAYRRLALKYHPDKCKDLSAEEMFKRVTGAYSTLIDKVRLAPKATICYLLLPP